MSLTNAELGKILHLDLPANSRFLLILMMQRRPAPSGPWTFHIGRLKQQTGWGRDKVQRCLGDLKRLGLVEEPTKNNEGRNNAGYRLTRDVHRILKTSNWKSVQLIGSNKERAGLGERSRQFCIEHDALIEPVSSITNVSEGFREFAPLDAYEQETHSDPDQ